MNTSMIIQGSGGKGGGGGGSGAQEAPDSLRSKQFARVLDLLGEGEIEGLVNGLQSVYFNGTPLQNPDGSFNFNDVNIAYTTGTQVQDYLPGFSSVESEVVVSTEVTYSTPIVRTISNSNVDAIRVTITIPQLTNQDTKNGNLNGDRVTIAIDVQNNGSGFVEEILDTIIGKTTSQYQRNYRINLAGSGPWDIRVRRVSADSASAAIQNRTFWGSYTEIIDKKFRYPNSVVFGTSIDAAQFDNVPSRAFDVKLLKVLVPSNYFPLTRKYTRDRITGLDTGIEQIWDGSFYISWSDNPAWCWYDIVTSERYGLGKYIDPALVDKWGLYTIAKYCDQLVPDGFGGMEPRFTCNLYLQTREEAYNVVNAIASIFRGLAFWSGGSLTVTHDAPNDYKALFNSSNIIGGQFSYSGSSKRARHTVVLVTWNDPSKEYRQEIEYVEDWEGIARYGIIQTEIVAVGCTSRGQAHRVGRWLLYTEKSETEIIQFKTGLEGSHLYPGAIIMTQDYSRSGKRHGGRILSSTISSIEIDSDIQIENGKEYSLSVVLPDGSIETRQLSNTVGITNILTFNINLSNTPQPYSIWVVSVNDLVTELWRVVSLGESSKVELEITAVEYHEEKFDLVEFGIAFEPAQTTSINTISYPPSSLSAVSYLNASNGLDIIVSWTAAQGTKSSTILWRKDNENFESAVVYGQNYTIKNASIGTYTIIVSTVNTLGTPSTNASLTYNVVSAALLPDVTGLALKQPFVDQYASFVWDELSSANAYLVQIEVSGVVKREVTVSTNWFNYHYADSLADGAGVPFRTFTLKVKAVYGTLISGNWVTLVATNNAPPIPAATITAISGGFQIFAPLPNDSDYAGMQVWASTVNGFTPNSGNLVYDGINNSTNIINLTAGVPYYIKVAFYDVFGKSGLNISSQYTITPLSNASGIDVVSALPSTALEGKVVYLTTDDKLYRYGDFGWATWVDGTDLLTASVTAGKINVVSLSALSANMGTLTSGNITVDATGFIRGGSSGYLTGTGFWMGYHTDQYKFHIGNPSGEFIAWTGTQLSVQTPQFTLSGGNATFSGALVAASGSFSGSLNAATGTFSGSMTADAVNAVNTINLAGNAVTIPVSAYNAGDIWWSSDVEQVIISASTTSFGNDLYISATMFFVSGDDSGSAGAVYGTEIRIKRDGIIIYTGKLPAYGSGQVTYTFTDRPGVGAHTYQITGLPSGLFAGVVVRKIPLFLFETKR